MIAERKISSRSILEQLNVNARIPFYGDVSDGFRNCGCDSSGCCMGFFRYVGRCCGSSSRKRDNRKFSGLRFCMSFFKDFSDLVMWSSSCVPGFWSCWRSIS